MRLYHSNKMDNLRNWWNCFCTLEKRAPSRFLPILRTASQILCQNFARALSIPPATHAILNKDSFLTLSLPESMLVTCNTVQTICKPAICKPLSFEFCGPLRFLYSRRKKSKLSHVPLVRLRYEYGYLHNISRYDILSTFRNYCL